jgi:hypothetical protein
VLCAVRLNIFVGVDIGLNCVHDVLVSMFVLPEISNLAGVLLDG